MRSILLGVLAVVAAGLLATFLCRSRPLPIPPEAAASRDEALSWARRDDVNALTRANAQLAEVVKGTPHFVEARADLAVVQVLLLDDVRVEIQRLDERDRTLTRQIAELESAQAPADWLSRTNVLRDELIEVRKERPPLMARQARLEGDLAGTLKALEVVAEDESPALARARLRAEAFEAGVRGDDVALQLNERLKQQAGSEQDRALIYAEYVLNSNAPPDSVMRAAEQLDTARTSDRSFVRPYVLGARLAIRERKFDAALSLLDTALSLNGKHALASHLREWTAAALKRSESQP